MVFDKSHWRHFLWIKSTDYLKIVFGTLFLQEEFHTKNTKKNKITKRNKGVFVRYHIVKLSSSVYLQQPPLFLFVIFV